MFKRFWGYVKTAKKKIFNYDNIKKICIYIYIYIHISSDILMQFLELVYGSRHYNLQFCMC